MTMEFRVLIHAPRGRDAAVARGVLAAEHEVYICEEPASLVTCLHEGAAAAVVTEEALAADEMVHGLVGVLVPQPPWSDLPFIVLATRQPGRRSARAVASLHSLGN